MCLLAFAWSQHPRYALALIANRDEFHARPAAAAAFQGDDPNVIGGADLQAGGSWLQLSVHGRLAAITNVRQGLAATAMPVSRGALVADFVRAADNAAEFAARRALIADQVGRHTLLLWDGSSLWQSGNHPAAHASPITPGLHTLSNAYLDAPWPKSLRVQSSLAEWLHSDAAHLDSPDVGPLFAALADDRLAADADLPATGIAIEWERQLSAAFIRGSEYGTRCSTIVLVAHTGAMWFEERRFGPQGVATGVSHWRGMRAVLPAPGVLAEQQRSESLPSAVS